MQVIPSALLLCFIAAVQAQYYCKPDARECYPCAPQCSPNVKQYGTEDSCRAECPTGPHCYVCKETGCTATYGHEECTLMKQDHSVFDSQDSCQQHCENEEKMQADRRKNRRKGKSEDDDEDDDDDDDDDDEDDNNSTSGKQGIFYGTRDSNVLYFTVIAVIGAFFLPAF